MSVVSGPPIAATAAPAGGDRVFVALAIGASVVLLAFLALPFLGVLLRVSPAALLSRLRDPLVLSALRLSLVTAAVSTAVVALLGAPTAWLLAARRLPGQRFVEVLLLLPMVLPPTVAGLALLMAFGRMGLAGHALSLFGVRLPFTTAGVVVAQVFMSAPFFVVPARAGFAGVDRRLLDAAGTLRAGEAFTFFRVVLPLARPALIAGLAMSAARALGEFGATITFAGNFPGTTQTMPLAVYVALQSDLDTAVVLAVLLLLMSFGLLLALRGTPGGLFGDQRGA